MELYLLCFPGFEHRLAKERSWRKETSNWQLRKVHHRHHKTPAVVEELWNELSNESSNQSSNEIVPYLPDCSLKVEVEHKLILPTRRHTWEKLLTTITRRFINSNRKLTNSSANCKIPSGKVTRFVKDCLTLKTCKAKDSNAAFYTGFQSWDTLIVVF